MRILVATGGAAHSDEAVRLGGVIQQMTGGTMTILTVVKHEAERPFATKLLARAASLVDVPEMQTRIRFGRADEEIVQEVADGRYNLLVVGERSHHGIVRRWLAPTTDRIIGRMPCPVLIARGGERPLHRALVCESGRHPLLISRLIDKLKPLLVHVSELTILHVMSQIAAAPGIEGWALRADSATLIEHHTPEGGVFTEDLYWLDQLNVRVATKVRHGLVVKEILAELESGDYDLAVIGAHQSSGWERFLLDDLAKELVSQVKRPLLVI